MISGTSSQQLYQSCRWGAFTYTYAVPNGTYTVNLKFAEPSQFGAGKRVFNVAINGTPVLTNFDIYAQAGALTALDKSFSVTATSGQIGIAFTTGSADYPLINAIEIVQPTGISTAGTAFVRVNAGSGAPYTDASGNTWSADGDYVGGYAFATQTAIANTTAPGLYQTCRWGSFGYQLSVPNGNYTLTLKFAEVSQTAAGKRLFSVAVNGTPVLTNFDVFAAAGGEFIAIDKSFPVTVTNGQIDVAFTPGTADLPLINGIEISGDTVSTASIAGDTPHRRFRRETSTSME